MEILERGNKNKKKPSEYPGKKKCPFCGCRFSYEDGEVRGVGNAHIVNCPQCNQEVKVLPKVLIVIFSIILIGMLVMMSMVAYFAVASIKDTKKSTCPNCGTKNSSSKYFNIIYDEDGHICEYDNY